METYLAPVERPLSPLLRIVYGFTRRQFGKVPGPISVFSARMPFAFLAFYGKLPRLDRKLTLPQRTAMVIRGQVMSLNACGFCMDAARWYAMRRSSDDVARFDALPDYPSSPLYTDAERAALDYATELTRDKRVPPATFERLRQHYGEREICEIVWLVASEHLYNISNLGLNIGSDGLCPLPQRQDAGHAPGQPDDRPAEEVGVSGASRSRRYISR